MKKIIELQKGWQTEIFSGSAKNFDLPLMLPAETINRNLVFRRNFTLSENEGSEAYFLTLKYLSGTVTVWIDGQKAATHSGMFAPFSCEITPFIRKGKKQELRLELQPVQTPARLYTFGAAEITCVNQSHFDLTAPAAMPLTVKTEFEGAVANLFIDARITLPNNYDVIQYQLFDPSGRLIVSQTAKPTTPQVCLSVAAPMLWDGTAPVYRYRLTATLHRDTVELDRAEITFGLRNIQIGENGIFYLNDLPSPLTGVTLPPRPVSQTETETLSALGCNSVLLESVFPGEKFLRFCDQKGILVFFMFPYSDLPGGKDELQATVRMLSSHPCVCFYGYRAQDVNLAKSFVTAVHSAKASVYTIGNTNVLYQESFTDSFPDILLLDADFTADTASQTEFENRFLDVCRDHPNYRFAVFAAPPLPLCPPKLDEDGFETVQPDDPKKEDETLTLWHERLWEMFGGKKNVLAFFAGSLFDVSSPTQKTGLIGADRDDPRDCFRFYQTQFSVAGSLHICRADDVYTSAKRLTVKCYSNQPRPTLLLRGKQRKSISCDMVADHVYIFRNLKLRRGNNTVVISAGNLTDSTVFRRQKRKKTTELPNT